MTEIRQSRKVEYHKWKRLIESRTFNSHQFPVLHGSLITLDYLKLQGFNQPILVPTSAGLDMRMPPTKITIDDVRDLVGKDRVLDVLVVSDQSGTQMTLGEFQEYFDNPKRTRIYNVITLELAGTLLASMITRPKIVRDLDWTDVVWPRELKEKMDYPRVQLYCLMGVENSYTDFHIDFGGSSVFYHVIWGCKIFYMIPPTSTNLAKYSQWSSSPNQADVFFGDLVRECYKVVIQQGNTMLIPSGWIHAVYTPKDTLVIGGNFLHSLAIAEQLAVAKIEVDTEVPYKFRYPYFTRMLCYVAGWYYKELKNEPPPAFCPKVLEDLPLLAQHLSNLAHKVADMNLTKDDRKKVMAEFPREYTNLKTLSLELKRLIEWHLEGRPPGKVGELFWEPGLDEMEFFDSSEDLSDHLPRDSDFESTSEENFEESEDEDFRIHAISSQKWEDEELPKSSKESMKPVVSASLKPKLKKIPAVIPKAAIKIQNEPTKEVPLPKFKVPAPKSTISVTQAVNIPPKRKDTTKAKLKSIMNGLKRSKHR